MSVRKKNFGMPVPYYVQLHKEIYAYYCLVYFSYEIYAYYVQVHMKPGECTHVNDMHICYMCSYTLVTALFVLICAGTQEA